jgi:hypothetical protein
MDALAHLGILAIKVSPFFWKGLAVIICAFILFVGSVYVLLSAVFGLRMGYLVVAVSFFGWMIILSTLWTVGPGILGTPANLGPRGYEPHWQVFVAGTGAVPSKYDPTAQFPEQPWKAPSGEQTTEVDTVKAVMQKYLAGLATEELAREGQKVCTEEASAEGEGGEEAQSDCFTLDPEAFAIQDVKFTQDGGTQLVGAHGFYGLGGTELAVFAYFDKGNVQKYSVAFLVASIVGFALHLPLLDRAERKRKEILTGGTAPPWFGPA